MNRTLPQRSGRTARSICIALVCALLASCAGMQTGTQADADARSAQTLSESGDHKAASRAYLDLAVSSSGAQRQRYLIFAAGELYRANDLADAERVLGQAGEAIEPENLAVWAEVSAELSLARGEPERALQALNRVTSTDRQSAASRILLLRSEALFQLGRPEPAVATLLRREAVLGARDDVDANRRLIWTGLQKAGAAIPPNPVARDGDPIVTGWLQLGYIAYNQRGSLNGLYGALESWQRDNRGHPASGRLLSEVLDNLRALSSYPQQVALLLPVSGKQKAIGQAIRDGYLAAHFNLGKNATRPDIRIYDTDREPAAAAYQRAILDGASFIVGPLLKDEVGTVAPLVNEVTTLALNIGPDDLISNERLFQFALAPEDEARTVAARATDNGLLNAIALVPDDARGRRILAAFETELRGRGGQLLEAKAYANDSTDFSAGIKDMLLLDESYARRDRLAANLGKRLEFEPRRRQDVDFIFLVANAAVAKLIKPQLRFHYAGEIPTYATSGIYLPGSSDNSDINGILFPDIPWLLEPTQAVATNKATLETLWGSGATRLARFYAMGYDAYHLSAMLQGHAANAGLDMDGMTGRLYTDQNGVLHRRLKWARMERGVPRTLPDTPRSLTGDAEIMVSEQQ